MSLFSVVIPTYNDVDYLERSIGSVLGQSCNDWSLIVIDDGSTDATSELLLEYERQDSRISSQYQDNSGVSSARNLGVHLAESAFVVFLDADDELDGRCLEQYAAAISERHDTQWLIGASQWERDGLVRARGVNLPATREQRFVQFLNKDLHLGNVSNMCFARERLLKVPFPEDMRFSEDAVVIAILLATVDPVMVPGVTATAHRRDDSLRTRASLQELMMSPLYERVFDHPLLPQPFEQYEHLLRARHCRSIAKRAYKEGEYEVARGMFREMLQANPKALLDFNLIYKFVVSLVRA